MFQHRTPMPPLIAFSLKAFVCLLVVFLSYQAFSLYSDWEEPRSISHSSKNVSVPLLHASGGSQCLPRFNSSLLIQKSDFIRKSCQRISPYSLPRVRIGTVTAHYGEPQEHYHKALQTHLMHSLVHDMPLEIMCSPIIDEIWNKPAFILSLLLNEMMKPPEERLEWLFWVDLDSLILDHCRPVSSFLPPEELQVHPRAGQTENETHFIAAKDWNGINAGIFLVRVNQWAIELFSDIMAFRHYKPDVPLPFAEQSAMEIVMSEPRFQKNVQGIPPAWLNAYPGDTPTEFEERENEEGLEDYNARRGDFLLHFAGLQEKDKLINEWADMLWRQKGPWERERRLRNATASIQTIWAQLGHHAD